MSDPPTLACPNCGHQNTHITTTHGPRRYRVCRRCHETFTTYEVTDEEYDFLRRATERLRVLALPREPKLKVAGK